MKVRIRFFARFRELLGTDIVAEPAPGTSFAGLVREVARRNGEGYRAIFDDSGAFREHVILMRNGKRIEAAEAGETVIDDGDEIAVFPPVSGG
ncbi:MAG TPA: ubiquitin-like small modifier protein 1 [Methanomicrobiales archaeon]|nr:ubiquitin-like small modifier protein 1 [Methanomicrobiales archaeon]